MKNTLLLSLVLVLCTVTANAQAKKSGKIKFGPQLGINLTPKIGAFGEYKFTEELGVQSGLLYFRNMYLLDSSESEGSEKQNGLVFPKYVAIPVILRGYMGTEKRFCIFMGGK